MSYLYILFGFITLFIIGLIRIIVIDKMLRNRLFFLHDYRNEFIEMTNSYFNSSGYHVARTYDQFSYSKLVTNLDKAIRELSSFGLGEIITQLPTITVNANQAISSALTRVANNNIRESDVTSVDNIFSRSKGRMIELKDSVESDKRNPFKWFLYGVRFVLSSPVRVLSSFGLINKNAVGNLIVNQFFKVVSGVVSLVGFISSIITIVLWLKTL